jgi:nucleotide-binding universal stress UspA family protein
MVASASSSTPLGADTEGAVLLGVGPGGHLSPGTVEFAVTTAIQLSLGIEVLHVVPMLNGGPLGTWEAGITIDELVRQGQERFDDAVERVRERMAGAQPVTGLVLHGGVIDTLVERSALAQLVVLERRDAGRWERWSRGSVTAGVAARAHAPVVSVPAAWQPPGSALPITVAVEDAERAAAEIWTALGLAAAEDLPVVVLRAAFLAPAFDEMLLHRPRHDQVTAAARRELEQDVALAADVRERIPCTFEVHWGRPADVLVDASRESSLLVVARRDPALTFGSHLGGVVRRVLREAVCPVLVVEPTLADPVVIPGQVPLTSGVSP